MEQNEKGKDIVAYGNRAPKQYVENIEILRSTNDEEQIDPHTYLHIIWKHKKIGFILILLVLSSALIVSLLTKPMYLARSTVEIALQKPQIVGFQDVMEITTRDPEFFNTQRDLIASRAMAEAVLSKYDLWDHPDFYISEPNLNPLSIVMSYVMRAVNTVAGPIKERLHKDVTKQNTGKNNFVGKTDREKVKKDRVINKFLSRVTVTPSKDSRILTIDFEAYSSEFAAKMADAMADTYIEWSHDRVVQATRDASKFLQEQLDDVEGDLALSEKAFHQYMKENNIVALDQNMNQIYGTLQSLNNSLAQTTADTVVKESIYKSVASGNYDSFFEVVNDPLIQKLKGEYNDLMVQYSDLSSFYKSEYPPLKKLQAKIEGVRGRLNEEIKSKVEAIETDYKTAAHKEELLTTRVEKQEKLAMALNDKTIQYKNLQREVQSNQSIYESLLQRLKETDVTEGIKSSGIQVVDHASVPLLPFKPNIPRNLMLAFVVGLIGAVGIAFLREFFDRTIKTPDEIRERMRLPVLGTIFKLKNHKPANKLEVPSEMLYLAEPISPFSESIRSIRTSILLSSPDNHLRSLLITSSWPGEGKTTLATNLAISFANGGKQVLLIDGDFRHPSLGRKFGIKNGTCGIGNYLLSKCELIDAVHPTDIPKLSILPGGSERPRDVSELLHSNQLKRLLQYSSEKFDYIVLDSSPTLGFSDSLMLATVVDGTVVVASTGITMQKDISTIVKRLYDIDARFLGVVINRVEEGRDAYYDHYNHYYKSKKQQGL